MDSRLRKWEIRTADGDLVLDWVSEQEGYASVPWHTLTAYQVVVDLRLFCDDRLVASGNPRARWHQIADPTNPANSLAP